MKQILCLICSVTLMLNLSFNSLEATEVLNIETQNEVNLSNSKLYKLDESMQIENVSDKEQLVAKQINFNFSDQEVLMNLKIYGLENGKNPKELNYLVSLFPSKSELFKGLAVIGDSKSTDNNFEVISLRVEKDSKSYTLIENNKNLEGKVVLTIGLKNLSTQEIYMIQEELKAKDFELFMNSAILNNVKNKESEDWINNKEVETFSMSKHTSSSNNSVQARENILELNEVNDVASSQTLPLSVIIDQLKEEKEVNLNQVESNFLQGVRSSNEVVYRVDDSIFKSGEFDSWEHKSDMNNIAPYAYSYITYRFAGTDNRLTYLVYMDIAKKKLYSNQEYSLQLTIRDNISILYNIHSGDIGLFGVDNRIDVDDIKLFTESGTTNGVFNARYYTHYRKGSIKPNIVKAAISFVPYVSTAKSTLETLTASNDTKTNKWYHYTETAAGQSIAYKGVVVHKIEAEFSNIYKPGDYVLLKTEGNAINYAVVGYTYSVDCN